MCCCCLKPICEKLDTIEGDLQQIIANQQAEIGLLQQIVVLLTPAEPGPVVGIGVTPGAPVTRP